MRFVHSCAKRFAFGEECKPFGAHQKPRIKGCSKTEGFFLRPLRCPVQKPAVFERRAWIRLFKNRRFLKGEEARLDIFYFVKNVSASLFELPSKTFGYLQRRSAF